MTDDATLIALLDIREKIAECRRQEGHDPWLIPTTLRHKAEDIAARFVDPSWVAAEEDHANS